MHNYRSVPSDIVPFRSKTTIETLGSQSGATDYFFAACASSVLAWARLLRTPTKTSVGVGHAERPEGSLCTRNRVQRDFLESSLVRQRQDSVGGDGGGGSLTLANGTQVDRAGVAVLEVVGAAGE